MATFTAILSVFFLALVAFYWRQFNREVDELTLAWLYRWAARGVAVPVGIWMVMNFGSLPFMPPLNTHIAQVRAAGNHFHALLAQTSLASAAIISCWAALTFGWFLACLMRRAHNREDLILALILWSPAALPIFWVAVGGWGWSGVGIAAVLWLWPVAEYSLSIASFQQPAPAYSRAIGKIKFGKYAEAELAIVGELEKYESDFDGWMMLADLYARQFDDLTEAEKTICDLCDDPGTTLPQIAIALHKLADWHLELRADPVAARRVLEALCSRMPGTHLANMARARIRQLPATAAELNESRQPRTIPMPALSEDFNAADETVSHAQSPQAALAAANQLVEKLHADPADIPTREKLARIFAEQLGRFDLAIEQLASLAELPGQPPEKMAEWLGHIAAWQIRLPDHAAEARQTLERLVHEFPRSVQAFAAQRRLTLLDREARLCKTSTTAKK